MISTPYLRIAITRVENNIQHLAAFGREHGIGIRPHTKTHKSLDMARRQLAAGAIGLTVAKPGEAEVMAQTGADILLAYPVVDPQACRRIAQLSRHTDIRVAIDSAVSARHLATAAQRASNNLGILVDIDVGVHRTGVQSPQEALSLAREIDSIPSLHVDGLFCYPGHIWDTGGEQAKPLAAMTALLEETLSLFRQSGIATDIVSGGSTPTAYQSHRVPPFTEIRPGTYIFNDMNTVYGGFCSMDDCAAHIICTVVSDAVPGQVVIDAGSKTLTMDRCVPRPDSGFGYIVEYPQATITALSEEHGQVDIRLCERSPQIGERLTIIPNHICPCVNLQDRMWLLGAETEEQEAVLIDARGKIS